MDSRVTLKTVDPSMQTAVFVNEGVRKGIFSFKPTQIAEEVLKDPLEGMVIAPAFDPTGKVAPGSGLIRDA